MRNRRAEGFTLIELLIVIAIIGILAAVLIPNLLNARERAFDTAAQTCLKELAVAQEVAASIDPFVYDSTIADGSGRNACANVTVTSTFTGTAPNITGFTYTGQRLPSPNIWVISEGTGVTLQ